MNITFTAIWCAMAAYYLLKKRDIDLFAVIFFTSSYYSYPLFFNFLYDPDSGRYLGIDFRIYIYYIFYFVLLFLSTLIRDRRPLICRRRGIPTPYEWLVTSLFFLSVILFLYPNFFNPSDIDSPTTPSVLGPIYPLFVWSSFGLFWLSLFSQNVYLPYVGAFFITLTTFAGGRSFFGALILSFVIAQFLRGHPGKPVKGSRYTYFIYLGVVLILMILYKVVYLHILTGDLDAIIVALTSADAIFFRLVEGSEPYLVMMNLQNSLNPSLSLDDSYRLNFLFGWVPVFSNAFSDALGYNNFSFSDILDKKFYTTVSYGMASSIVGELFYVGGYVFIAFFLVIFNILLFVTNSYIYKSAPCSTPCIIWCFYYYHRLEFKHIIYVLFVTCVCFCFAFIVKSLLNNRGVDRGKVINGAR
jgi:hypothetical protein